MFISINKGLFEDVVTEEINTSLKLFEDKMNSVEVPSIKRKLKVAPLSIEGGVSINNSIMIENQIIAFFSVPQNVYNLTFSQSVAPRNRMEVRAFHENGQYITATFDTKGNITLSEHLDNTWVYATWIVSKNSLIK